MYFLFYIIIASTETTNSTESFFITPTDEDFSGTLLLFSTGTVAFISIGMVIVIILGLVLRFKNKKRNKVVSQKLLCNYIIGKFYQLTNQTNY